MNHCQCVRFNKQLHDPNYDSDQRPTITPGRTLQAPLFLGQDPPWLQGQCRIRHRQIEHSASAKSSRDQRPRELRTKRLFPPVRLVLNPSSNRQNELLEYAGCPAQKRHLR